MLMITCHYLYKIYNTLCKYLYAVGPHMVLMPMDSCIVVLLHSALVPGDAQSPEIWDFYHKVFQNSQLSCNSESRNLQIVLIKLSTMGKVRKILGNINFNHLKYQNVKNFGNMYVFHEFCSNTNVRLIKIYL